MTRLLLIGLVCLVVLTVLVIVAALVVAGVFLARYLTNRSGTWRRL